METYTCGVFKCVCHLWHLGKHCLDHFSLPLCTDMLPQRGFQRNLRMEGEFWVSTPSLSPSVSLQHPWELERDEKAKEGRTANVSLLGWLG